MQYARLGLTGLQVSRLCLGSGAFGVAPLEDDAVRLVHHALDRGVTFFDTANSYGNSRRMDRTGAPEAAARSSAETILGRALRGRRDDVVLSTKVREPVGPGVNDVGLSRRHILQQAERSLRALQTDYIDVYHMHGPDFDTPLEETMGALSDLVHAGKVRYLGFSNYPAWWLAAAVGVCRSEGLAVPVVHQIGYNLLQRAPELDTLPAGEHFGIGTTAYSPLCMGLLSGADVLQRSVYGLQRFLVDKSAPVPFSEAQVQGAQQVERLAAQWGHAPAAVALAWLFTRPLLASAIIGPENAAELDAALPATEVVLDAEQLAALDAVLPPPPSFKQLYGRAMAAAATAHEPQ